MSCPGCLCPGEGDRKGTIDAYINDKQPTRDEPHSYGCIMLAMVEAHRNGIEDIPR
jgi:unsaturated rhamnogalacturonyl hydrolase